MNYSQTLEFLTSAMPSFQQKGAEAYKPGLERIVEFCHAIGNPQRNFFTIHVAGTDGKGSVSSMIAAVLQSAGYTTGLFTSPHLHEFRERIRVDGAMIPKQKVVNFVDKYRDKMLETGLSFFEMTAAMAFDYFDQSNVEVAVIETGLGGRLDATNIITPIVSVITNISLEHTSILGDTVEAIAAEKAGIIKKSIPVVIGERNPECDAVFAERAAEMRSKLVHAEDCFVLKGWEPTAEGGRFRVLRIRDGFLYDLALDMGGEFQCRNLITACTVLDLLHEETPLTISRRALLDGLRTAAADTGLHGRWERIAEAPAVVCDTGHTPCAFEYTARRLAAAECRGRKVAVLGFASDKKVEGILSKLEAVGDSFEFILTRPSVERALPLESLRGIAAATSLRCEVAPSVAEAYALAVERAGADGFVFIGGSNYVVAEIPQPVPASAPETTL